MFPSIGSLLPPTLQPRRTHFHIASTVASEIKFDAEDYGPRKKSFLPAKWSEDDPPSSIYPSVIYPSKFDRSERKVEAFCTGSKYLGEHNALGIARKGLYKYPHGVIYDGFFNKNGEFHGTGSLIYPNGQRVEGIWKHGKLIKGANYVTGDGTPYASEYCSKRDRRFQIEVSNDLRPAGEEYLTNAVNPPREIRKGCYDAGEGFFSPKENLIYDYNDPTITKHLAEFAEAQDPKQKELYVKILASSKNEEFSYINKLHENKIPRLRVIKSVPTEIKERWIIENCRKAWDEPVGFRRDLYETWTTGKSDNVALIQANRESKLMEDKVAKEIAKLVIEDASTRSLLFSFIVTLSSQNYIDPKKSMFNRMLLPRIESQQEVRGKINKKITPAKKRRKHTKGLRKEKSSKDSNNITYFTQNPKQQKTLEWKL